MINHQKILLVGINKIKKLFQMLQIITLDYGSIEVYRYNIIHMQTKYQLMQVLLVKDQTKQKCNHQFKNTQAYNYERNKQELIQQLLAFSSNQHKIHIKSQTSSKLCYYFKQKCQSQNQKMYKIERKDSSQDVCQKELNHKIYFNEYFQNNNTIQAKSKKCNYNHLVTQQVFQQNVSKSSLENSEQLKFNVLDFFTKKNLQSKQQSRKIVDQNQNQIKKSQNKSFQNQSTLAVSKLAKSPQRGIRKTENKMDIISNLSAHAKRSKSPQKLTISKVSAIQIRVESSYQRKPEQQDLKAKSNANSKQNLSYSSSVIHITGNQFELPSDIKAKTPSKNSVLESFSVSRSKAQTYNMSRSPQQEIYTKKFFPEKMSADKIAVIKETSSQENQTKKFHQQILDESEKPQNKLFAKKGGFLRQQKLIPIDFRKVSKIQDQLKFKRQIQEEKQRRKGKQLFQSVKNRQRSEKISIFNGCPTLVYEEKQRKQFKQQPLNTQNRQNLSMLRQRDQTQDQQVCQESQKHTFFDFLKGKISNLTRKNKEQKKPQDFSKQKSQKQIKKSNQFKPLKNIDDKCNNSMQAQLSQGSSSSNSFFKQKRMIEEKGVLNVDLKEVIDQSIKIVSINLQKAEENLRKSAVQNKIIERSALSNYNEQTKRPSCNKMINISKQQLTQKSNSSKIENQKEAFQKIFGASIVLKQNQIKEKQRSLNHQAQQIDDFFSNQNLHNKFVNFSQPSTVQKNQERSVEKSDFFNQLNLEEIKDCELIANLFQKIEQPKKRKVEKQESFQNVLSQLRLDGQKSKLDQSKLRFQNLIKESAEKSEHQERQIKINLMNFRQVSLSFDAFSFSKFQSLTERQQSYDPTLNSFKVASNLKQNPKQLPIKEQVTNPTEAKFEKKMDSSGKRGKVQRIQINIDESDQSDEQQKQETSDSQLDVDQIQDYVSDQEEQTKNQQAKLNVLNEKSRIKLAPIIEEDLQQSQLIKQQFANVKKSEQINQEVHSAQQAKLQQRKQLESELLKDFKMNKVKSVIRNQQTEEDQQKIQQKIIKSIKTSKPIIKKVSLIKNLSQPQQSSISSHSVLSSKELSKTQKELIETIKEGIEGLKQKISSVILSQPSKNENKFNEDSQLHSQVNHISIDLDDELQDFNKNDSKPSSNLQVKLMKEKSSFVAGEEHSDRSQKQTKNNINFDEFQVQSEQGLYKQFKQTFMNLKKRIEDDHKYY